MTSNIFNQQETSNMFKVGLNSKLELTLIKEAGLLFICSSAEQVSVTIWRQLYVQIWVVNGWCMAGKNREGNKELEGLGEFPNGVKSSLCLKSK